MLTVHDYYINLLTAFLCDSWHCSRSLSNSFLSGGGVIGPSSSCEDKSPRSAWTFLLSTLHTKFSIYIHKNKIYYLIDRSRLKIKPTTNSFSFCLSSSSILARDANRSPTLEPTFVSSTN